MELKKLTGKLQSLVGKYRYALLVLVIGLALLLIPGKDTRQKQTETASSPTAAQQSFTSEALAEILQSIQGAGKVKVLLSTASGEETVYQTDSETSTSGDGGSTKIQTVIVTDSQRSEAGLIRQVNPPGYLGAIVVCEGADNPTVKLAVAQAVAKITGLGTDAICVLKMK
ncbi:MAG: hypothetical protein IJX37_01150 [Oscillospiraceae bacterium]|nr:hypothetical protein [Oscillospiraceae bacterium]